jgi:membrane protease subunit (stomatin/prohibitin family)
MIKEAQRTAMYRDPGMAGATLVGAQADAMRAAAANENGAMMGFMGMGMAYNAGGMNAQGLYAMGQQNAPQPQPQAQPQANGWTCSCGTVNSGNFCAECGSKKPEAGWICSCGAANKGKFCSNCGTKKPSGAKAYKCDKCGWEPENPQNPPRFCPECGDPINDDDIK